MFFVSSKYLNNQEVGATNTYTIDIELNNDNYILKLCY